jgi:crossover junction endodeoxyribonuclease RusA
MTSLAKPRRKRMAAPPFSPMRAIEDLHGLPEGVRVVLPWPPAGLNPNRRHAHPTHKARIAAGYRRECWALALERFGTHGRRGFLPEGGRIAVRLDFYPPTRAKRDDDNCEAMFKAGRDGVAEALKIDDGRFVVTRRLHSEPRGCVVMTFTGERAA